MAQQTIPADGIQRIVIAEFGDDLSVHGWEQQAIKIDTDEQCDLQQEGDTLTVGRGSSLVLWVPFETMIVARAVGGDILVEGVRQVELAGLGSDVMVKNISGNVTIGSVGGDVALREIRGAVSLSDVGGEALLNNVAGSVTLSGISGDLALMGVVLVAAEAVGGDCTVRSDGNGDVKVNNVGGGLVASGVIRLLVSNIGSDCQIRDSSNAEVTLGNIGSDLQLIGASSVRVGNVGSDCDVRDVRGDVELGQVEGDATVNGVGGALSIGNVAGDASLRGLHGAVNAQTVGGDLMLQADFPAGCVTRMNVGGDAVVALPEPANLTLRANVGGDIRGRAVVSTGHNNRVTLTYGEGAAQLELQVGGDLVIRGNASPRSSSSSAGDWHQGKWGKWDRYGAGFDINIDMSEMGHEIKHEIKREMKKGFEHSGWGKRYKGMDPNLRVRINNREWHLDPQRLERILEQAEQAAAEGIQGALDAVEQALRNLNIPIPPMRPAPPPMQPMEPMKPMKPMQPMEPMKPMTPFGTEFPDAAGEQAAQAEQERASAEVPATPLEDAEASHPASNPEQEREAILRMIAEGRISPEEGDLLLEALG
jgi:DUF4097 and DUF4098 domain-containing protein YvlB